MSVHSYSHLAIHLAILNQVFERGKSSPNPTLALNWRSDVSKNRAKWQFDFKKKNKDHCQCILNDNVDIFFFNFIELNIFWTKIKKFLLFLVSLAVLSSNKSCHDEHVSILHFSNIVRNVFQVAYPGNLKNNTIRFFTDIITQV